MISVNIWAVLVSALAAMAIGSVWYGPLFGKVFISAMGMDKLSPEQRDAMKKGMSMTYVWQFIASFVMLYVFAWIMIGLGKTDVMGGLTSAFWVWLGFVVPLKFSDALWGGKMPLFWLGIGSNLVTLLVAGVILGAWR